MNDFGFFPSLHPFAFELSLPNFSMAANSLTTAKMTLAKMQRRTHGSHPLHWRIAQLNPPCKNVNSAVHSLTSACNFGGKIAKIANRLLYLSITCR